jgi:hypothetical protein
VTTKNETITTKMSSDRSTNRAGIGSLFSVAISSNLRRFDMHTLTTISKVTVVPAQIENQRSKEAKKMMIHAQEHQ